MAGFNYQELLDARHRGLEQLSAPTHEGDGWVRIDPQLVPFFDEDAPVIKVRLPVKEKPKKVKPAV